jgi:hypothetical protein
MKWGENERNLVLFQIPSCTSRRGWEYTCNNEGMHTGVSVALGKMYYHVLICHLLKEVCLEFGQLVLFFLVL